MRKPWLDCARGLAVLAMVIYHFTWDLSHFELIQIDINTSPFWRGFARIIAGSFLFLSGISLYYAHSIGIRWPHFIRRLAILSGAAALITLVTWYQFPDSYIFFGILHCLALSSVIALLFLRVYWGITFLVAIVAFAAPFYLNNGLFDEPFLAFIGLRTLPIRTNDYVPLLPWISPMLLGLLAGQLIGERAKQGFLKNLTTLQYLGRYSLIIYLLHQPILFEITGYISSLREIKIDAATSSFIQACEQSCTTQGRDKQICIETCFCTVDGLKATGVWATMNQSTPDAKTRDEITKMAQICGR